MLGITLCKGFDDLLRRPFRRWMFRDGKVKNFSPLVLNHQEHKTRRRIVGTVKKSTATTSPM